MAITPEARDRSMKKSFLFLLLFFSAMLSACSDVTLTDASEDAAHRRLIGERYEVIGVVDAYGIRRHSKADVEYITLVPRPGFKGPEVGFKVRVDPGSVVRIDRVVKTNRWFDCRVAFIVSLQGMALPEDETIRIEMNRGNEGSGCLELNPELYRSLRDPIADHSGENA
jgi:hypothetical protein